MINSWWSGQPLRQATKHPPKLSVQLRQYPSSSDLEAHGAASMRAAIGAEHAAANCSGSEPRGGVPAPAKPPKTRRAQPCSPASKGRRPRVHRASRVARPRAFVLRSLALGITLCHHGSGMLFLDGPAKVVRSRQQIGRKSSCLACSNLQPCPKAKTKLLVLHCFF